MENNNKILRYRKSKKEKNKTKQKGEQQQKNSIIILLCFCYYEILRKYKVYPLYYLCARFKMI